MAYSKESLAKEILIGLYTHGFIETIFNTEDPKHYDGWTLKGGVWSPWYLNLRPIGDNPELCKKICFGMNSMLREEINSLDLIIGVDIAGIPIASISGTTLPYIPFAYTRPFPEGKPRNVEEARIALSKLEEKNRYDEWGGHHMIEGRLRSRQNICIVDDMVTDLGSKLIAKEIILYETKRLGLKNISCNNIAVVLDREQGAEETARKSGMKLHSLIKFRSRGLEWLKDVMVKDEYNTISFLQREPIQNSKNVEEYKKRAIEKASEYRNSKKT